MFARAEKGDGAASLHLMPFSKVMETLDDTPYCPCRAHHLKHGLDASVGKDQRVRVAATSGEDASPNPNQPGRHRAPWKQEIGSTVRVEPKHAAGRTHTRSQSELSTNGVGSMRQTYGRFTVAFDGHHEALCPDDYHHIEKPKALHIRPPGRTMVQGECHRCFVCLCAWIATSLFSLWGAFHEVLSFQCERIGEHSCFLACAPL